MERYNYDYGYEFEDRDGFRVFDPMENPAQREIAGIGELVADMGVDAAYKYCNGRRDEYTYTGAIDVLATAKTDLEDFKRHCRFDTPEQIDRIMYILEHVHDDEFMETADYTECFCDIVSEMSTKAIMKAVSEVYGIEYKTLLHRADEHFIRDFWDF